MLGSSDKGEAMFEAVDEKNVDIEVTEIKEDEEDTVGNWRIQLDIKTSRRKLKLIEKMIRENIQQFI